MCLERANSLSDLPKVLQAYEAIRKPRAEYMCRFGRLIRDLWNLPDCEEQRQRDAYFGSRPVAKLISEPWDGKNVDDPPDDYRTTQGLRYLMGYDILDYVGYYSRIPRC